MIIIAASAAISGCATFSQSGRNLSAGPNLPAAEGTVWFNATRNDNVDINVRVKHLAHPEKLTPPSSTYVIWTRRNKDAAPQNIGELVVDSDLTGVLRTETPLHSFDLFITAEASGQVQKPAGEPLLWTSYSR